MRAHRSLRAHDRPVELKPWLHRIVRNLCIDELRRSRPAAPLEDGDRAGAGEDVYSTLSRRHELRGLIDDLADLPEQQRAALLMRELDGLSHDEVAETLEITPEASRQLVKRARAGLVSAAEARDADCASIRDLLLTAHDEKRRPSEHAIRHLRGCARVRRVPRPPEGDAPPPARAHPADRLRPARGVAGRRAALEARRRGLLRPARPEAPGSGSPASARRSATSRRPRRAAARR